MGSVYKVLQNFNAEGMTALCDNKITMQDEE